MRPFLKYGSFLAFGGLAYDYTSEEQLMIRSLRTIRCGLNILYQYKVRFDATNANEIHELIAKDIYETCLHNDGLFVKFGQGMAAMDHLLPPPYYKWMSLFQDKARAVGYSRIQAIVKEETGKPIEEVFQSFEETPVASASIAQVHRAVLKTGETVAVKIQKPNIRKQFKSDMYMHHVICAVLEYAFDLPLLRFQKVIEDNLSKEIDFTIEYDNAELARQGLIKAGRKDAIIPKFYTDYTTKHLLVSEWIDGIKITHQDEIRKLGFNPKEIMETVIGSFAEQIFITGFVNCDPHPGNIFVRPQPDNPKKYQVVLLDFGLCIRLDKQLRQDYAKFWKYLFLHDKESIKDIVKGWGVDNLEVFATMQLMKPYKLKNPIHSHKITQQEVLDMQMKMKGEIKEMMKQTQNFPQDLLFINRNMNLVRSVNKKCGSLVNRINIMARYAQKGSQFNYDLLDGQKYQKKYSSSFIFELKLFISSIVYNVAQWWVKLVRKQGIEDVLEEHQLKQINEMYGSYGFQVPDQKTFDA